MSTLGWILHFVILGAQAFVAVLQWKTHNRIKRIEQENAGR